MTHTYALGQSGSGKSTLLKSLLPERTFCIIDPHGSLAREIADSRTCLFLRPADLLPIGLNPFTSKAPKWKITADTVAILSDIWNFKDAPRMSYYLRASVRLLLDTPGTTLLDIRRVLSDDTYRNSLLEKCTDTETRQTWEEFTQKAKKDQAVEVASLQNKIAALASYDPVRLMLTAPPSLNFDRILAAGQTIVVDLSDMGAEPAALIGALIVNSIKQAAEAGHVRDHYSLIIDEFQTFGTSVIATILSEARKWHLELVIAHQFLKQIDEEIRDAILGNCSTLYCFAVGPDDAAIMAEKLDWSARDLQDQAVGTYRYVTNHKNARTSAMLGKTKPQALPSGYLAGNIENMRRRYCKSRKEEPQRRRARWG